MSSAALASLLLLPGIVRSQSEPAALRAAAPAMQVCTGGMPDGSGDDIVMTLVFTPDGRHLLLGCRSGAVELRSLEGVLAFRRQPRAHFVGSVAVSADGSLLMSASGNTIQLWSGTGEPRGSFNAIVCDGCSTSAVVFSPDGGSLLSGHDDASAVLWSLKGEQLRRFEDPRPFVSSGYRVVRLAFDPAGGGIAVGHENGTLRRWSASGRPGSEIDSGIEALKALAFTPAGDLVAAGHDGAKRWDAQGRPQAPLRAEGAVEALQLLPDGSAAVLAGTDVDDVLELRDLQGRLLLTFHDHSHSGAAGASLPGGPLAVSPDGRMLVVAEGDQLHRWELPAAPAGVSGTAPRSP